MAVLALMLGCQIVPDTAHADEGSPPLIEFALGLPGKQAKLSWTGELGARYHVEKSTDLGAATGAGDGWTRVALVEATGPMVEWRDPQAVTQRCFYRVTQPQAEVFSIQPPVLSADGGNLLVWDNACLRMPCLSYGMRKEAWWPVSLWLRKSADAGGGM